MGEILNHPQKEGQVGLYDVRRGEIYRAELPPSEGSVQQGERPVLIVQNDVGNTYSPNVIVLTLTSQMKKLNLPTHTIINCDGTPSVVQSEMFLTIPKRWLKRKIDSVEDSVMNDVETAMFASLGFTGRYQRIAS